jgi:hypothetical protein
MTYHTFTLFFILQLLIGTAYAKEINCSSELRFEDEGTITMSVKLIQDGTQLHHVELENTTVVNATKTGYTCSAEFDRNAPSNSWSTNGSLITIKSQSEGEEEPSRMTIKRTPKGYLIDTRNLSKVTCGARAEWPVSVFVPMQGSRCKTRYE